MVPRNFIWHFKGGNMCEFISWIEKDGGIFFLSDKEVFSEEGKESLKGCEHNDFLGHGAIRSFYDIKGGVDKEKRDFWNGDLPKELQAAVNNFDTHFGGMLREGYFQNDDLRYIISCAPDKWKAKAAEKLKLLAF